MLAPFKALTALLLSSDFVLSSKDLCSVSFCECPEAGKSVICQCENNKQTVELSEGSLPKQATYLSVRDCGDVSLKTNGFSSSIELKTLDFRNLSKLDLSEDFFSSKKSYNSDVRNLTIVSVGELVVRTGTFRHFPKCSYVAIIEVGIPHVPERGLEILTDVFILSSNNIGVFEKTSLYSDASYLTIKDNRIEKINSGAFDASVRHFSFVGNTVDNVLNNGISVAFQDGEISNNTFKNQEGRPFQDVGPDPTCMADPDSDYDGEEQIIYNIVANPAFKFANNYFLNYTEDLLHLPGANNVPLGSLYINGNKVKCDCESLIPLASVAEFDYLFPLNRAPLERGNSVFLKEFYNTGLCINTMTNDVHNLKKYLRDKVVIENNGKEWVINCSTQKMTFPEEKVECLSQIYQLSSAFVPFFSKFLIYLSLFLPFL